MTAVAKGSRVRIAYVGKLKNGTVFDRSEEGEPLEFTVGEGRIITGIEKAVEGMNIGEEKTVAVSPDQGYGQRDDSLIRRFPKAKLPEGMTPAKGMILKLTLPGGDTVPATITDVTETDVFVDLNHPLAGEDLTFEIRVVGVEG
jgi:peptidylprolyl isomerase